MLGQWHLCQEQSHLWLAQVQWHSHQGLRCSQPLDTGNQSSRECSVHAKCNQTLAAVLVLNMGRQLMRRTGAIDRR